MAGGRGSRMMPLTEHRPKPLLPVGDKPIIEHNVDRLIQFGFNKIYISVNYLGEQIKEYFGDGSSKGIAIDYVCEDEPMGTIGCVSLLREVGQKALLVMNSDLLTDIDFGSLYDEFSSSGADLAVASTPYHVDLPYAVMEIENDSIRSLQEKPRYTYFANAGIYLMKTSLLEMVPSGSFYNSTDLIQQAVASGKNVMNFPIVGYWLDIGRITDYAKAQEDIKYLQL
jgi:NDP-sugar pyrophosphorylase family protein